MIGQLLGACALLIGLCVIHHIRTGQPKKPKPNEKRHPWHT
jgi:hypothetical protein